MGQPDLALGMMWYVLFLLAITCHEAAHAWAALKGGDPTAYDAGQVTLNPLPHIKREPMGTILVPILSYLLAGWMLGWASAPYDRDWEDRYPRRAAWMALAGPCANLILTVLAGLLIHLGLWFGVFMQPESINFTQVVLPTGPGIWEGPAILLSIMFVLNLLLTVFNLIPVPPLDGSTAIGIFMKPETVASYREFIRNPTYSIIGLLLAWELFDKVFPTVFHLALRALYPTAVYG